MRRADVVSEEVPRGADDVIRCVDTDVADPHDMHPGVHEGSDQARRLRIVKGHDVTRTSFVQERRLFAPEDPHVRLALRAPEGAAVTHRPVEPIVDPLGDPEEVLVTFDDQPSASDRETSDVAEELMKELGNPSSVGCGVDVPDGVSVETFGGARPCPSEPFEVFRASQRPPVGRSNEARR